MKPILTALQGTNSQLVKNAFDLYVPVGSVVADVTYGKGVFWKDIDKELYKVFTTDLIDGIDFGELPYENSSIDVLILDPPYMHGGETIKESINKQYRNANTSHASVIRLYTRGILEASRVLKKKGIILVKTQDEIESGKQRFSHIEIMNVLGMLGFSIRDMLVLVQETIPAMRESYQKTARKNHSYLIVGEFKG